MKTEIEKLTSDLVNKLLKLAAAEARKPTGRTTKKIKASAGRRTRRTS